MNGDMGRFWDIEVTRQWLKIDATAVFFPITVTGGLQAASATDFRNGFGFAQAVRNAWHILSLLCLPGNAARMGLLHHPTMVNPLAMPFKLNFNPDTAFALSNHSLIRVQGSDAKSFLQSQCMNDVNLLGDNDWQYNGWLNPQGRVMALFYLLRISTDSFVLILPELPPEALIASLQRFKFRSKLSLSLDTERHLHGMFLSAKSGHAATGLALRIPGRSVDRILSIAAITATVDLEAMDQWHCLDIQAGWIWLTEALQNRWTPQMLSLDRLNAFSLKKGCYPGQEIVARTHYLGKSKRRLQSLSGAGLQVDQPLSAGGQEFGVIVNSNSAGSFASAVITADAPEGPWLNASGESVFPAAD